MKKTFRLLFAAAALLGFAACADVPELPYPLPDNGNGGGGDVTSVTVAQFNAASVSNDIWYQLTGTASGIKDGDVYGNFDLTDETGKVYVYGLLSEKGGAKQQFQSLVASTGLANGDKITIHATRGEYNSKVEAMNAYFVRIVEKGEGGGGNTEAKGDGTKASPYNVAAVRAAGNPGKTAWVKGYIVGTIKDGAMSYSEAVFGTADASNTNFLLADDASCTNAGKCIPVQLPTNLRDALSLQKNPGNLGQIVYLNGSLEKYFGQPGLKNVTEYSFDGTGGGDDGGDDQGDGIFSADFTKGACGFTAFFTPVGDLAYVWAQSASYGWKGSAYKGGNIAAESWLVSPAIDLSAVTSATMTFNQAVNYTNGNAPAEFLSVCISTDYAGDPATTTWNVLSVPSWPEGNSWDFSDSGDISLTPYCGQKIVIGFRYTSTEATAPTWEVKNCIVK